MIQIDYQQVKEELAKVGLKATHPRIVVFSELMSSHVHPTADQLFERIKNSHPSIAKGTVYRVLDHLVEAGVVYQVASKDGIKRYDANLDEHNHIYCTKTHAIQDYHDEQLNDLIRKFFEQKQVQNFKISDIKLQINGEKIDPDQDVTIV